MRSLLLRLSLLFTLAIFLTACTEKPLRVLIIDGQNNHAVWPKSTVMMKEYLENTGRYVVDVDRTKYLWRGGAEAAYLTQVNAPQGENLDDPKSDPDFAPNFKKYDVVISNFGWKAADWSAKTQRALEEYVAGGGGFVSVHAADNSFPQWKEYNKMIGLGGWGGRNESHGPYVYYDNDGKLVRDDSPGNGGAHGQKHEFPVTIRVKDHPITQGLPTTWLTTADECYAKLRGPAENLTVLATGKDQSAGAPTDRHEPVLMVVDYGQGRVFHTTLGHDTGSFEGVGFITTFLRGVEWAATGTVRRPEVPADFPTADEATRRKYRSKVQP